MSRIRIRDECGRGYNISLTIRAEKTNKKTNGALLAEELNNFFAPFETKSPFNSSPLVVTDTPVLAVQQHEVRQVLKAVNPRKAAGPDGIPGKVLRACYNELSAL